MTDERTPPTTDRVWPDIETVLKIIANARARLVDAVATLPERFVIPRFTCARRTYFSDLRGLMAVFPYDVEEELDDVLLALLPHAEPPIEYWFLEDNRVDWFGVTDDEDPKRARRWHAAKKW